MEIDERELIVAANRYVEGKQPEDLLKIVQSLADTSDPEKFKRKLRLLNSHRHQQQKT